jgi:hypothetical protein
MGHIDSDAIIIRITPGLHVCLLRGPPEPPFKDPN